MIPNKPQTATRWPTFNEVSSKPETATRWPSWDEVTGKPSTFPVSSESHDHTHLVEWPRNAAPFDNAARAPREFFTAGMCVTFVESTYGWPIDYGKLVNIPSYTSGQDGGAMQILIPYSQSYTTNGQFMWRIGGYNNAGWTSWFTAVSLSDLAVLSNQIGAKLDSSAYTASDVLAKMLSVDGAGSGLDADRLDGNHASYFYSPSNPPPAAAPTTSQVLNATKSASVGAVGTYAYLRRVNTTNTSPGATVAGSALKYAGENSYESFNTTTSPSGTWRCMGNTTTKARSGAYGGTVYDYGASLFLRIS